jgi:hypothetical protein
MNDNLVLPRASGVRGAAAREQCITTFDIPQLGMPLDEFAPFLFSSINEIELHFSTIIQLKRYMRSTSLHLKSNIL